MEQFTTFYLGVVLVWGGMFYRNEPPQTRGQWVALAAMSIGWPAFLAWVLIDVVRSK